MPAKTAFGPLAYLNVSPNRPISKARLAIYEQIVDKSSIQPSFTWPVYWQRLANFHRTLIRGFPAEIIIQVRQLAACIYCHAVSLQAEIHIAALINFVRLTWIRWAHVFEDVVIHE